MGKKVFVSGCFDVLHSGHVAFFEEAATHGDVYVSIGSDETILKLKKRPALYNQDERQYMLEAIRFIKEVHIGGGEGMLDFVDVLEKVQPDIFFVNSDGDTPAKRELMAARGIAYIVSKRQPKDGLPPRSTTAIRTVIEK